VPIEEFTVDIGTIRELREVMRQAALEVAHLPAQDQDNAVESVWTHERTLVILALLNGQLKAPEQQVTALPS
jgi:hypothetical protein